ncbi:DMT family transporter [Sulfitobacter sp. LCG007]
MAHPGTDPLPGLVGGGQVLSGNALAVGSILLWSAGFPAADLLLTIWRPEWLIMMRLLLAVGAMLAAWFIIEGPARVLGAAWRRGLWIGFASFGLGTYLLLVAQWYTDPVTVALIASTTPISATVIEVLSRQRRMTRRFMQGLAASVIGGLVATGADVSADLGLGVLMALGSGILFAWGSNAAVRDFPDLSPLGRSTVTLAGACVFAVPLVTGFHLAGIAVVPAEPLTWHQVGLLSIYAVAALALSQVMFNASVGRIGVALTSFHINVAPFYVMLILLAMGGDWNWSKAAGAALVALGVLLSQLPARPSRTRPVAGA